MVQRETRAHNHSISVTMFIVRAELRCHVVILSRSLTGTKTRMSLLELRQSKIAYVNVACLRIQMSTIKYKLYL